MTTITSSSLNLPLRWESTGDQWWYASPIDVAAANGSYDLVRHLLSLDPNLLIKLTSLRRIRRLESVWEDNIENDHVLKLADVAKNRADVALKLFRECVEAESENGGKSKNSLIGAGYGGWLVYTAASAGDVEFVKEVLEVDKMLVFGEGEYGLSDVLYAGARSGNAEVFRLLVNVAMGGNGGGKELKDEVMNRAVHAASRGGFVEMVKEMSEESGDGDVMRFRDHQGCSVLHSAAAKGQVKVVRELVRSFKVDPLAKDNQGNTVLHMAAYRGHSAILDELLEFVPAAISVSNNNGDTFLHMAVAGFQMPGFHRIDKQVGFFKYLISGGVVDLREIVNVRNKDGRTALHLAIVENISSEVVELLMGIPSIVLNCSDNNGMTPLDILKNRVKSADSEYLMRHIVAAGGRSSFIDDRAVKNAWISKLKLQGITHSPGTSFRIPDAEILMSTANENGSSNGRTGNDSAASEVYTKCPEKLPSSRNNAATRLRKVFQQVVRIKKNTKLQVDNDSTIFHKIHGHVPLRQKFAKGAVLPKSSSSSISRSSSYASDNDPKTTDFMSGQVTTSHPNHRSSMKKSLINQYFCFGTHSLVVENLMRGRAPVKNVKNHRRAISMAN